MKVLVIADVKDGNLKKTSFELLSLARQLEAEKVVALLLGHQVSSLADKLAHYGAGEVLVAESPLLENYQTEAYAKVVENVCRAQQPDLILLSATINGKDLAPRVAARLDYAMVSDVTGLKRDGNQLQAIRPMFAGNAFARLSVQTPALVSMRPNMVSVAPADLSRSAAVTALEVALGDSDVRARVVEVLKPEKGKMDVSEADIVVSGGRGMKGPENYHLLEELADVLGGAVGASRAVVDDGWRPHGEQVGQTGKTISPSLYVACGISGAMQHLAGMSSSKVIVAINTDADAPIFKVATYGLVADIFEAVPQMIEECKKLKAHS